MLSDCWHQLGDFAVAEFPFSLSQYEAGAPTCIFLYIYWELAARVIIEKLTSHCVMLNGYERRDALTQLWGDWKKKWVLPLAFSYTPLRTIYMCGNEDIIWWENEVSLVKSAACTRAFDIVIWRRAGGIINNPKQPRRAHTSPLFGAYFWITLSTHFVSQPAS